MNELARLRLKTLLEQARKNYIEALGTLPQRNKSPAHSVMAMESCDLTKKLLETSFEHLREFEIRSAGCTCRIASTVWNQSEKTIRCRTCNRDVTTDIDYSLPKTK